MKGETCAVSSSHSCNDIIDQNCEHRSFKTATFSGMIENEGRFYTDDIRARFHEQRFTPKSLPKLHTLQSTVTIFHGIITVSQY